MNFHSPSSTVDRIAQSTDLDAQIIDAYEAWREKYDAIQQAAVGDLSDEDGARACSELNELMVDVIKRQPVTARGLAIQLMTFLAFGEHTEIEPTNTVVDHGHLIAGVDFFAHAERLANIARPVTLEPRSDQEVVQSPVPVVGSDRTEKRLARLVKAATNPLAASASEKVRRAALVWVGAHAAVERSGSAGWDEAGAPAALRQQYGELDDAESEAGLAFLSCPPSNGHDLKLKAAVIREYEVGGDLFGLTGAIDALLEGFEQATWAERWGDNKRLPSVNYAALSAVELETAFHLFSDYRRGLNAIELASGNTTEMDATANAWADRFHDVYWSCAEAAATRLATADEVVDAMVLTRLLRTFIAVVDDDGVSDFAGKALAARADADRQKAA